MKRIWRYLRRALFFETPHVGGSGTIKCPHQWRDISEPVVGRRNLNRMVNGVMIVETGPEETFFPGDGFIPFRRQCERCGQAESMSHGRWHEYQSANVKPQEAENPAGGNG